MGDVLADTAAVEKDRRAMQRRNLLQALADLDWSTLTREQFEEVWHSHYPDVEEVGKE